jgi:hypothetical protein
MSMQYKASTILTAHTLGLWAPVSLRAWIYVLCLCWLVGRGLLMGWFPIQELQSNIKNTHNFENGSELDQVKGPNPLMLKKNYNLKNKFSCMCSSSTVLPALVQLNHCVVLMQITLLVKGKEAVLDTSVMQLEYYGYCLMLWHVWFIFVSWWMYTLRDLFMSPFPFSISSLVICILHAAYVK